MNSHGHPHDATPDIGRVDCSQALLRLYEYLDGEILEDDGARIKEHLDDCVECLQQYQLEVAVKAAIKRACVCEQAPVDLRHAIMTRISITHIEWDGTA